MKNNWPKIHDGYSTEYFEVGKVISKKGACKFFM